MIPAGDLLQTLSALSIVLTICMLVGGFLAFRNGRQTQLTRFQSDTNTALQQRVAALEGKAADLEKENVIQRHLIETITQALAQRGMLITISGDMVTITDQNTGTSSHRKRLTSPAKKVQKSSEDASP